MGQDELEQSLVLIKPDALKLSLTGYILSQLSEFHTGLRLAGTKIVHLNRMLAEEHYADHRGKSFFGPLIRYIMGCVHYADAPQRRRVVAIVYSGQNAVTKIRGIVGPTSPHVARDQLPGGIRALGTVVPVKDAEGNVIAERLDNLVHASGTIPEAEREIKLWFTPTDMMPYMRTFPTAVAQEHFYLADDRIVRSYVPGAFCLAGPGALLWQSDLEALVALADGRSPNRSLPSVVAKYFINATPESS
ncbi:nucleoside-diphosphate kinase [Myxococcota bacterium]